MNNYRRLPDEVISGKIKMIDIAGFEEYYGITEDGRGWGYGRKGYPGRWLTPVLSKKCVVPFFVLHIRKINKRKTTAINKIVASAFINNPYNFSNVEFIDGDIHNSHKDNLKWMPSGNKCIVEGRVFESEFQAAKHYEIHKPTFKNRRYLGWSIKESLGLESRQYDFNEFSGIIYSITDKTNNMQYVGQTKTTLEGRMKAHFESTRKTKNINKNGILHVLLCNDKENFEFSLIEKVKDINDLNEREIFHIKRLKTLTPNGYNLNAGGGNCRYSNKISYNGVQYHSYADIARKHNMCRHDFNAKMKRGLTIDQILGKEPVINGIVRKKRVIEYKGIKYKSLSKMAKALNIPRTTLTARLNRGMTIEEAVECEFSPLKKLPNSTPVIIEGTTYKSKGEAARAYGIKPSIFIKRLREGWKLEAAIGIEPHLQWHE